MMKLTVRFQLLLLLFVTLGVYYPALFSGELLIDDAEMILRIDKVDARNFLSVFVPDGGYYYRPLLVASFLLDRILWDFQPIIVHLENVLLHAGNTVLVFILARKLMVGTQSLPEESAKGGDHWPLLAALFFAVHPICTESVIWISGRTDLMGTFFVLCSTLLTLAALERERPAWQIRAALVLLVAAAAKELMIFYWPVGCLLIVCWQSHGKSFAVSLQERWRHLVCFSLLPALLGGGVVLLKWFSGGGGMPRFLQIYERDLFNTVRVFFKVFGFYSKKLVVPTPLNFAILDFSDHYVWFGLAVTVLLCWLVWRRFWPGQLFLMVAVLLAPGLLIALLALAWTPVAERYLYLPSVFFCIGVVSIVAGRGGQRQWLKSFLPTLLCLLLFPAGWITAQRALLWQDGYRFFADILEKSPGYIELRNELAIIQMDRGEFETARENLELVIEKSRKPGYYLPHINLARLYLMQNDYVKAREALDMIPPAKLRSNPNALKVLARIDEHRFSSEKNPVFRAAIGKDLVDTYKDIFGLTGEAVTLYRAGQISLFGGDTVNARDLFKAAYEKSAADDDFHVAAGRLFEKLRQQ